MVDFARLEAMAHRKAEAPPTILGGFAPFGLDDAPDEDFTITQAVAKDIGEYLDGITFAIEYIDSNESKSRRRVSIRGFSIYDDRIIMKAVCLESSAFRSFRVDRIQAIIDLDGVVYDDPLKFFKEILRLSQEEDLKWERLRRVSNKPGREIFNFTKPGTIVLCSLALSDGFLHEAEMEVMLRYVGMRADQAQIEVTEQDWDALIPLLRRQYPTRASLTEAFSKINREPPEAQRLLLRSAVALMNADGIQHPAEFALLLELQQELGG